MKVDPETSGASKAQDDTCKKGTPQEEAGVGLRPEKRSPVYVGPRCVGDAPFQLGQIGERDDGARLRRDLDGLSEHRLESDFMLFALPIFTGALAWIF